MLGGQVGFEVGSRAEASLHDRPDSRFYKTRVRGSAPMRSFQRFGEPRAVVLSRFLPVVRTFTSPIVAIAGMPASRYTPWNVIGGVAWTVPIILLGRWLGHITFIRQYIELLAVIVVIVSIVPVLVHMARYRE